MRDPGSVVRVRACSAVDRATPRRDAHRDLDRSCGAGCPPHRPGPQRHRPRWDETDASGPTGADSSRLTTGRVDTGRPDTRRVDTGRPDTRRPDTGRAGHWTRWTPDGRTPDGWTAGPRTTEPDWWTPHAGRGPTPWQVSWPYRPRRQRPTAGCRLDAPPGSRLWATNQPGQLSSKDYQDGPGHRRNRQLQMLVRRPAGASAHCCPQRISGRA
jgi:hypothetical protein